MTTTQHKIAGKWKQFRGEIKNRWGTLTGIEHIQINGNRLTLEGRIQERFGVVKLPARPPD